jgi:HSP20 family protein
VIHFALTENWLFGGIEIAMRHGVENLIQGEMFMSNVAVEKVRDGDTPPPTLFERMTAMADKIRQRAFEVFECRGCGDGRSLEDWLQAERDVVQSPEAELIEKDGKLQVRVALPGFDVKDIRVTALPTALFIEAEAKHKHEKTEGDVYLREFGQKQLFRRLDMPAPINVDKVTATLDRGVLQLTAPKTVDPANEVKVLSAA